MSEVGTSYSLLVGTGARAWRTAMAEALYGDGGFYRRGETPGRHFRTSVTSGGASLLAEALHRLALAAGLRTVIDMGSGGGELLTALHLLDPTLDLHGVDIADRPAGLPTPVRWWPEAPAGLTGLLVANEWLDNVPVDVVIPARDGPRVLLVDGDGDENPGPPPDAADTRWLHRWWPPAADRERLEVGRSRDEAWAAAVRRLAGGLAVAIDYGHLSGDRPPLGSLTGFRRGRETRPVPDGTCDLTAHVAIDACRIAGEDAAGRPALLIRQRTALRALGVDGRRPPLRLAAHKPREYAGSLARASMAATLTDATGLGAFWWLLQPVDRPVPAVLAEG